MFEWFRAIHIIGIIAWMAGLMIYPRLLVYRLEAQGDARFEAAMDKAVKAGARPGCAALKTGELLVTLFAKDAEAAMKKRPAAPKKTVQGAGWDGAARELAKVHDNSV